MSWAFVFRQLFTSSLLVFMMCFNEVPGLVRSKVPEFIIKPDCLWTMNMNNRSMINSCIVLI